VLEGEELAEIIAVGDIMPGRGVSGESDPFGLAAPWLSSADLAVGNFEGVLAEFAENAPVATGDPETGPFLLRVPADAVLQLQESGLDLLGLANNHALDLGPSGLADTVSQLEGGGLQPFGAGPTPETAWAPVFRQFGEVRLALLACSAVPIVVKTQLSWAPASCETGQAAAAVKAARAHADAVIILVHWGYEYDLRADPAQRALAKILMGAGADLILGVHSHTIQGTEVLFQEAGNSAGREGFVAYSLGNFVFDQADERAQEGLALRAFFDREGLRAVQAMPVWSGLKPRLMDVGNAAARLDSIAPPPMLMGFACDPEGCKPASGPAETRPGLFWSGEIDLTGDGQPELVRRFGGGVTIIEDGRLVWQSPIDWDVQDLALGDPNDDGRGEVLLVLLKPDTTGELRSHPFIVGYRGGRYWQLWGGSAVSSPIREVEVGDVDGDGVSELVVLEEERETGLTALSVWRWHGWGFSLHWRSEAGEYQKLTLSRENEYRPMLIQIERLYAAR
jgi:poly-gamma-glutamate synthesis protein (capsule biosynthesis protein)